MVWMVWMLSLASPATSSDRLVEAVEHRDWAAVSALLKQQVDVNTPQADGATALHWAAHWDHLETADQLVRAGASVNVANDHGVTPLALACLNGSAAMAERLLRAGANANAADATGETVLMTAARTGNAAVVKALVAHRANVNAKKAPTGQTALMWAVSQKHPEVVRVLIEHGADVHARSQGGFTPLLFAAREGTLESARLLLEAGVNVNEAAPNGTSPLTLAIVSMQKPLAMSTFLLEKGADANGTLGGYAALHAAVASRDLELVQLLLAHGADPNARLGRMPPGAFRGGGDGNSAVTLKGATPFVLAAAYLSPAMMRVLAASGADPVLATEDGTTPLMVAAGLGQSDSGSSWKETSALEAVKFLVQLGADVTAVSRAGNTPLHGAAYVGADSVVQFLVEQGAGLDVQDKRGQTPFRVAQGHRGVGATFIERKATAELLRKLGANTSLGIDPHILFRERGDSGVVK
jgi:ankyrin repeat protein